MFYFLRNYQSSKAAVPFCIPPAMKEGSCCFSPSPAFDVSIFDFYHVQWYLIVILIHCFFFFNFVLVHVKHYNKSERAVQEVSLRKASLPPHPATVCISLISLSLPHSIGSSLFRLSFYICFVHMSRCKSIFLYTIPSYMKNIHILPHVRIVILKSVSENTSE